ncbi:MAG TPA: cobalamin B12-binding domain-containing protein [Thermodesulfobacterium geofontis]|nr:cobalamin B12-binding domain-containing protein [Thermodesulfobacterium geofontis]
MKRIRVLIAKPGLDGHDRGAKLISRALMDAGYEVIYTGIRRTPEEIVNMAIEEDVNALGLSCLSGAHLELFTRVAELLKKKGREDILLFGGGTIPKEDIPKLLKVGFKKIFPPDSSVKETVDFLNEEFKIQRVG